MFICCIPYNNLFVLEYMSIFLTPACNLIYTNHLHAYFVLLCCLFLSPPKPDCYAMAICTEHLPPLLLCLLPSMKICRVLWPGWIRPRQSLPLAYYHFYWWKWICSPTSGNHSPFRGKRCKRSGGVKIVKIFFWVVRSLWLYRCVGLQRLGHWLGLMVIVVQQHLYSYWFPTSAGLPTHQFMHRNSNCRHWVYVLIWQKGRNIHSNYFQLNTKLCSGCQFFMLGVGRKNGRSCCPNSLFSWNNLTNLQQHLFCRARFQ